MYSVGQKVVCVDNTPKDNRPQAMMDLSKIKVGETYTIREILSEDGQAIALEEVTTTYSEKLGREIGYKSDRFRPLDSYTFAEETLERIVEEIEDELFVRIPKS
jgi:hypothetical protein